MLGPRPLIAGHDAGAEILMHAVLDRQAGAQPARADGESHAQKRPSAGGSGPAWHVAACSGSLPGVDRLLSHAVKIVFTPARGVMLSARSDPGARDLMRHAFADVPGNSSLTRSWAKCARQWPTGAQSHLLELYPKLEMPVLLLWADRDRFNPLAGAEEALELLPQGHLWVLQSTGFLIAYDDPVGLARAERVLRLSRTAIGR